MVLESSRRESADQMRDERKDGRYDWRQVIGCLRGPGRRIHRIRYLTGTVESTTVRVKLIINERIK